MCNVRMLASVAAPGEERGGGVLITRGVMRMLCPVSTGQQFRVSRRTVEVLASDVSFAGMLEGALARRERQAASSSFMSMTDILVVNLRLLVE